MIRANHLDLESITSLNDALVSFNGSVIFTSHDHEFISTIADKRLKFLTMDRLIVPRQRMTNFGS